MIIYRYYHTIKYCAIYLFQNHRSFPIGKDILGLCQKIIGYGNHPIIRPSSHNPKLTKNVPANIAAILTGHFPPRLKP